MFDSHEYTTGIQLDSKTFRDDDMDGQYDSRIGPGPGREIAVAFDSQWHKVIHKGNQHYVELDGKLRPVEFYPVVKLLEDE